MVKLPIGHNSLLGKAKFEPSLKKKISPFFEPLCYSSYPKTTNIAYVSG